MARHRLTRETIARYAELSHDRNPLHVDEDAALASPFKGIVAHGFLLLGGALKSLGEASGYPKRFECKFESPGRPGEELETVMDGDSTFRVETQGRVLVVGSLSG